MFLRMLLDRDQTILRPKQLRCDQRRTRIMSVAEAAHDVAIGHEHARKIVAGEQP